jgi:putative endonuclease
LYTGITVNVEQRFQQHITGKGARYTRSHPPECILAVLSYADRASATRAECEVKKWGVEKKLALCRDHAYDKKGALCDP